MKKAILNLIGILLAGYSASWAQTPTNWLAVPVDTMLKTVVKPVKPAKISHAEPLYLDLVRDLGARKGEREWNVGSEFSQRNGITSLHPFIEYEFAPINRVGLEVEIPFQTTLSASNQEQTSATPLRLHSIKTSIQWTYAVLERWQTSLAVGYTNEIGINSVGTSKVFFTSEQGHPFLVAAKKWGQHWHTLVYAAWGGEVSENAPIHSSGHELNLAMHYVMPRYNAFVGVEIYQYRNGLVREQTIRPQVRVALKSNLLIGLVETIALNGSGETSSFIRLIYEPRRR